MPMTAAGMKAKVEAAYTARTGKTMTDGDFQVLLDLCQGIIDELVANADVQVQNVQPGVGTANGEITG